MIVYTTIEMADKKSFKEDAKKSLERLPEHIERSDTPIREGERWAVYQDAWVKIRKRMKKDPYYIPLVALPSDTSP